MITALYIFVGLHVLVGYEFCLHSLRLPCFTLFINYFKFYIKIYFKYFILVFVLNISRLG